MEESKKLARQTSGILVFDVLISFWDMGLATYNFIQGRWVLGIVLVAVVVLIVWAAAHLLESKHDMVRMRMRHEYMMEVLKSFDARMKEFSDGEESQLQETVETAD